VNARFIFRNLGDLSCLSHEQESHSFKKIRKVVEKGVLPFRQFQETCQCLMMLKDAL
jgi:hypothetical protein